MRPIIIPCDFSSVSLDKIVCDKGWTNEFDIPKIIDAMIKIGTALLKNIIRNANATIKIDVVNALFNPKYFVTRWTKNNCVIRPTRPKSTKSIDISTLESPSILFVKGWNP